MFSSILRWFRKGVSELKYYRYRCKAILKAPDTNQSIHLIKVMIIIELLALCFACGFSLVALLLLVKHAFLLSSMLIFGLMILEGLLFAIDQAVINSIMEKGHLSSRKQLVSIITKHFHLDNSDDFTNKSQSSDVRLNQQNLRS